MSLHPHNQYKTQSISLKAGVVFGFSSTQPLNLACQQGCVWVTQNGVDLVLNAGEKIRLSAKDHIVVEALQGNAYICWPVTAANSTPLKNCERAIALFVEIEAEC